MKNSFNLANGGMKTDLSLNMEGKTFKEIYDSVPIPQRYAEIKNIKTNDIEFAERELLNIKKKEKRKEQGRVKIWEQPLKDETEKDINIRNKIFELKKKCQENHGFSQVDLHGQKFLTKLDLASLLDSKRILADRTKQKNNNKVESIFNFVTDNREISMKNFLLDLLKDERSLINSKEGLVSKTLKDSEVKLEKDYKNFVDFVEEEKRNQKLNEQKLIEYFNHNRELATIKKKLIQENKTVVDDLDRTVKSINNLKSNAAFVHLVLGDKSNRFKVDTKIFDTKNSDFFEANIKDKDLEKTVDNLIDEFSFIDLDKKDEYSQLLNDHSTMTMKFQEFEENILKLMENKQTIEKELERMQIENQLEINKLRDTEETMKQELLKLQYEKEKDEKNLKELKRNANSNVMNGDIIRMINELYMATLFYDESESSAIKKLKSKKETEYIVEIMDCLRKSEFLVIDYIDKLEKVSKIDEAKFKSIVHSRKEDNKKKKQQVQKIKSEEIAIMKKEKAEERMHRIIIKGKKIMQPILVGKGSDKKLINENIHKGNDEYNMLYYDQTEP